MSANGPWKEDKDHPAHKYGDSQVRHRGGQQNHESLNRFTEGRSILLQNYNQTVSAAGNSMTNQNISFNWLDSAFSSTVPQKNSSLHAQSSGADTFSIRPPINQQNQHNWNCSNLNTSENLRNTENLVNDTVPVPMQPQSKPGVLFIKLLTLPEELHSRSDQEETPN